MDERLIRTTSREVFRKIVYIYIGLIIVFFVFSASFVSSEIHPKYPAFSKSQNGFVFNNASSLVSVNDTIIYKTGFYSINGSNWRSFDFAGTYYLNTSDWIQEYASANIPSFGAGEHYVIVYSCTYNASNFSWDCHDNKWQLFVFAILENSNNTNNTNNTGINSSNLHANCSEGEYYFEPGNVCLLNVSGNNYFVSTNGNDANPGNFSHPWATFHHAVTQAYAGDTVYFRGGTYYHTSKVVLPRSGEKGKPINFINYPLEAPIFDCSNYPESTVPQESIYGIYGIYRSYLLFKGLTIQNITKINLDDGRAHGFYIQNSHDITFDQCIVNRSAGRCFQAHNSYSIYYYNCDAMWCADPQLEDPGNAGTGFLASGYVNKSSADTIYYYGCRAWSCADQGFGAVFEGLVIWDNCWSFNNGLHDYGYTFGCQCGFKIGYMYEDIDPIARIVKNSIAAYNPNYGFSENTRHKINLLVYNTTSYKNGDWGFLTTKYDNYSENRNIYRNNIAYDNGLWDMGIQESANHSYNSWDQPYHTPTLTNYMKSPESVNDDDFISLDWTEMLRPRKEDGSLPDIDFLRLSPDSDLIDAVINVSALTIDEMNYLALPGTNP
jgi:hypothetical protein